MSVQLSFDHVDFCCPITRMIFAEPVMTVDGNTYEKSAILKWFESHNTSPITGLEISSNDIVRNLLMERLVNQYLEHYPEKIIDRYIPDHHVSSQLSEILQQVRYNASVCNRSKIFARLIALTSVRTT